MRFIYRTVNNSITVEIVHGNLSLLLDSFAAAGIILRSVSIADEITAVLTVDRRFWRQLQRLSQKQNAQLKLINKGGIYWQLQLLLKRPVLITAIVTTMLLSFTVPGRVLIISVEGNRNIPEKQILEAAVSAGIRFGAFRRELRSERIKNRLLEELPQLQWVGINTHGCRAIIAVRERSDAAVVQKTQKYGSIVATRDGIIRTVNATKGSTVCQVGQAVKAGEVLISGYTDCGLAVLVTGAEGEVYAETFRNLETVLPAASAEKGEVTGKTKKYSLIIGKKRINFYNDSGICDTSCDKMYEENYLTLPGGFRLPVAIAVESLVHRELGSVSVSQIQAAEALQCRGEAYLLEQMVAGEILSAQMYTEQSGDACRVIGQYRCLEMIGRLQQEEFAGNYGKSN